MSSDLLDGLNAEQSLAVTSVDGPILVVAGPGSGKTRVLSHRVAYMIRELDIPADRILAVTFTNKAAKEMRNRIERLLDGPAGANGLTMGTFHALGVRFLRQNPGLVADRLGILPNFLIYDDTDQMALAKQSVIAAGLDPKAVAPRRMLSRISTAKSQLTTPEEFAAGQVETYDDELVLRVYQNYQRALRKANAVDFDDLLSLPLQLFDAAPSLLERYQERYLHVMVDEYQDTNRVQYVLVSALSAKHQNLFVVGDPDQSIYGWRQADIRNILDFQTDFPAAKVIHLELNYRSTRRIVDAADRVIRENTQRIDRRLRTENDDGDDVIVRELSDQNHEAQFIVSEVRRLKRLAGLSADGVAVMYRTTAQSRVIEEAFRVSDIPYRIVGGVRFYDRKEVKDVLAVIRLLYNPADDVSLMRVIDNLPLGRGFGPKAMDGIRDWATLHQTTLLDAFVTFAPGTSTVPQPELSGAARTAAQRIGGAFARLRQNRDDHTLAELFDHIVDATGYKAQFDNDSEEEMQRWANVLELRSDLSRYDDVDPQEAIGQYLEQVALISDVDTMDEKEGGRVTLITLHSAKGLEFPVVFITGAEEGLLPINRAVEAEFANPSAMEEERRLFYVGITRAMQMLYITYTGTRLSYGRYQSAVPSRFLASLPSPKLKAATRQSSASTLPGSRAGLMDQARETSNGRSPMPFSSPAPPVQSSRVFASGERVFHNRFGEGTIAEVSDRRGDQELAIDFVRHGRKRLLASLANLEPVSP